jgi:hypothetical protein
MLEVAAEPRQHRRDEGEKEKDQRKPTEPAGEEKPHDERPFSASSFDTGGQNASDGDCRSRRHGGTGDGSRQRHQHGQDDDEGGEHGDVEDGSHARHIDQT